MQNRLLNLLLTHGSQSIASAIVYIGLVSVCFAFWQAWPPNAVLIGASIGGALSPSLWKLISLRSAANRDAENEDFVNFPLQSPVSQSTVERESHILSIFGAAVFCIGTLLGSFPIQFLGKHSAVVTAEDLGGMIGRKKPIVGLE